MYTLEKEKRESSLSFDVGVRVREKRRANWWRVQMTCSSFSSDGSLSLSLSLSSFDCFSVSSSSSSSSSSTSR